MLGFILWWVWDVGAFVKFLGTHGHNFTLLLDHGNAEILRLSSYREFSARSDG